jgi:hypothetical protein
MQQITETAKGLSDKAGDYVNSEDFRKILPYLLTGGAGAVAGGLLTGDRKVRRNESRLSHLGRVLANAILVGGGAAWATALLRKSKDDLLGSTEAMHGVLNKDNTGPAESLIRGVSMSPVTALASGAAGLGATSGFKGALGSGSADKENALSALAKSIGIDGEKLKRMTAAEIADLNLGGVDERMRQAAGLASGTGARGVMSNIMRKGLSTFGQSWPKRTVRGAVGLTTATIPALLGAVLTKDPNEPVS